MDNSVDEDQNKQFKFNNIELACGHSCKGVANESECLPCLKEECIENSHKHIVASCTETELCGICFTSELYEEPCVRLACGHVFHAECVMLMLTHRWTTTKITFGYLDCPSCK